MVSTVASQQDSHGFDPRISRPYLRGSVVARHMHPLLSLVDQQQGGDSEQHHKDGQCHPGPMKAGIFTGHRCLSVQIRHLQAAKVTCYKNIPISMLKATHKYALIILLMYNTRCELTETKTTVNALENTGVAGSRSWTKQVQV